MLLFVSSADALHFIQQINWIKHTLTLALFLLEIIWIPEDKFAHHFFRGSNNKKKNHSPLPSSFWFPSLPTIGLLQVEPEKFDPTESSKLHLVTPTAIKLLLTDPPRFFGPPLLKCSITSQLDFLGNNVPVVVAKLAAIADVSWLSGDWLWYWWWLAWPPHACNSKEFWTVRVCLRDAARRVNPIFLLLPSFGVAQPM